MVSLNTALTLGVIGAAIAAFYGLGGASGIGSRIGSGLSSFGQYIWSGAQRAGAVAATSVIGEFGKKRSRTAPTRAAAPTPATTFPIVPLLNMFLSLACKGELLNRFFVMMTPDKLAPATAIRTIISPKIVSIILKITLF